MTAVNDQYVSGGVINGNLTIAGQPSYAPNIRTAAVRTKAGWRGQILLDGEIVWESDPDVRNAGEFRRPRTEPEALSAARDRLRTKLTAVFA